jgi:hypothetical protein
MLGTVDFVAMFQRETENRKVDREEASSPQE